jgi:AraC-like DNA-binding protein
MPVLKIKDGFEGERQINVPREILINKLRRQAFAKSLFITHIGYFPKAKFHYRERPRGCADNILLYCLDGRGHYQTAQGNYMLNAHQFVILPPGKFHIYQADLQDPWSIYWVHFSGERLHELNDWLQTDKYMEPTPVEYDKRIIEQWTEMYETLDSGYSDNNLAHANLCLYRFLTFFTCKPEHIPGLKKEDPVSASVSYMKTQIHKILTVDELASHLGYSSSHYSALFKSRTGSSPMDYFIRLKLHYACQLLSQTSLDIQTVAEKIGYEDPFYFSRLFKKVHARSPRDYRNTVGRKGNGI